MILLGIISDVTYQALIAAFVTLVLAYMNKRTQSAINDSADRNADKLHEVGKKVDAAAQSNNVRLDTLTDVVSKPAQAVTEALDPVAKI